MVFMFSNLEQLKDADNSETFQARRWTTFAKDPKLSKYLLPVPRDQVFIPFGGGKTYVMSRKILCPDGNPFVTLLLFGAL
jgi:hypothetical protein